MLPFSLDFPSGWFSASVALYPGLYRYSFSVLPASNRTSAGCRCYRFDRTSFEAFWTSFDSLRTSLVSLRTYRCYFAVVPLRSKPSSPQDHRSVSGSPGFPRVFCFLRTSSPLILTVWDLLSEIQAVKTSFGSPGPPPCPWTSFRLGLRAQTSLVLNLPLPRPSL